SHSLAHASHVFCLLLTLLSSLPNRRSAITVATHGETRPPRPTFPPHPSTKFPASVRDSQVLVILIFHTCPSLHSAYPLVKKIDISFSC
ncbi:hypothetical protein D0Y65_024395, partial [Glycine soja]